MARDRILVIDDESTYAEMLQTVLEQHYFLVETSNDPEEAVARIEARSFSLVITDFRMPHMSGADVLARVRDLAPTLPVVLVSGVMDMSDLIAVANMGVTRVFEKPIDMDDFLETVRKYAAPLSADEFFRLANEAPEAHAAEDGTARRTYPALRHLADASPRTVPFLNQLWQASREQTHILIKTPPGSEVELILRDMAEWIHGRPRHVRVLRVAHMDPDATEAFLHSLPNDEHWSHIVGIVGYHHADLDQQADLIEQLSRAPEAITFCHFINGSHLAEARLDPNLLDLVHESLFELPPLADRLADLAAYTERYLPLIAQREGKPACGEMDDGAIAELLGYGWPQNFAELIEVFRRAIMLAEPRPLSADDLRRALLRRGCSQQAPVRALDLETRIVEHQRAFIAAKLADFGDDLTELLMAARVPAETVQRLDLGQPLPLLFPELLADSTTATAARHSSP